MKQLHGLARAVVPTGEGECHRLLEDVGGYPSWYPEVVRSVEVMERDSGGRATRAFTQLHLHRGPLGHDFGLVLDIVSERSAVSLVRVPHDEQDDEQLEVNWRLQPDTVASTRVELSLQARLDVPRLLPLGGLADDMAQGFMAAAARALGAP